MAENARIVVFTGDLSYSVRRCIAEIDRDLPGLSWLIVLETPRKTPSTILRSQWRHLRRNGPRWIAYTLSNVWDRWSEQRTPPQPGASPAASVRLSSIESRANVRLIRVPDLHAPLSVDQVRSFSPDLGIALAAPILRRPLFEVPRLGTLNLHKGRLPDYRGMPPAFWELWNGEESVGCTVHWVDERLDTGDVVAQTAVQRGRFSTVRGMQLQLDEVGAELIGRAVRQVLGGSANGQPQSGKGKTYRRPTLAQVASLNARLRRTQVPRSPALVRALKDAGSELAWSGSSLGLSRLLQPRIVVLLYHRVSDDARDLLTVGIEQFDRQMALIRKHCSPMSLPQILGCSKVPRSSAPLVAITFDDGYLDNYVNAAPILIRHGLPAAFFVSTGILDRSGRFPHDVRLGNPHIPVMTWEHLRAMHQGGFVIGSHSANHIDCASEPEEKVRAELAESRDRLRQELGSVDPLLFAYPYGGRQHMTADRLELVKAAGYAGCLSAYGGANVGSVDRYDIRRRGIHWEYSDRAFLLACLGWR